MANAQDVTISLPTPLYEQLMERAARRHRTVAEEVLDVLTGAAPATEQLPDDLELAVGQLAHLDDQGLWEAARSHMPAGDAERLRELNRRRQGGGLDGAEQQESEQLVRQYERAMLVRAQAAALLKQRGHDVSSLLKP